ncbi:hypothetical protein [Sphingomonas sp. YL-JM2C]
MKHVTLIGLVLLAGCGEAKQGEATQASREQEKEVTRQRPRVSLDQIKAASAGCVSLTLDIISKVDSGDYDRADIISSADRGEEICSSERNDILKMGMDDPAEHLCLGIAGDHRAAMRAVVKWAKSPGASELRQAKRWIGVLGDSEKECGIALAG